MTPEERALAVAAEIVNNLAARGIPSAVIGAIAVAVSRPRNVAKNATPRSIYSSVILTLEYGDSEQLSLDRDRVGHPAARAQLLFAPVRSILCR
jgi:hypothetical protein